MDVWDREPKRDGEKIEAVVEIRTIYVAQTDVDGVLDWYVLHQKSKTKEINDYSG